MRDDDRRFFLRWAEQPEYLSRRREALRITANAFEKGRPYVAFSGGKDSTVLLHMARMMRRDTVAYHYDYGEKMPRKYFDEIVNVARSIGVNELVIGERTESLRRDFHDNEERMKARGFDSVLVGLRSGESCARSVKISAGYRYGTIPEVYPLAGFTANDIWAYMTSENVRYLSYYDEYSDLTDIRDLRFTTFFDYAFRHLGAENLNAFKDWRHAYE